MFSNIDGVAVRSRRPATPFEADESTRTLPLPVHGPGRPLPPGSPNLQYLGHVRPWMVVVLVDAALLHTPLLWTPELPEAVVAMACLSILFLTGGGCRARLHLSVLDELPTLLARLLSSAAIVATVIALRHDHVVVAAFLNDVAVTIGLVVLGRVATTCVVAWSRECRWSVQPTLLVGGGPLAAEVSQILVRHPRYGLVPVGYVDDSGDGIAEEIIPRLGGLDDLDGLVAGSGAEVVLVTGDFPPERLSEALSAPHARRCDLLVVPRMHYLATQTGAGDHIGSIPVMRLRRRRLTALARGFLRRRRGLSL